MSSPCIQPNPDISGIGVRISVYAQAFIVIARLFLFTMDGRITASERLAIDEIFIPGELIACSLLVSGFIQAKTYGLSVYHANILLVLSWITVLPLLSVPVQFFDDLKQMTVHAEDPQMYRRSNAKKPMKSILQGIVLGIHYLTVVGLGIWIWRDVGSFGSQPECTSQTFLPVVLFGSNVLIKNRRLKIAALCLYGVIAFFASVVAIAIPCVLYQHNRNTHSRPGLGGKTLPSLDPRQGPRCELGISSWPQRWVLDPDFNRDGMQERGQSTRFSTSVPFSSNHGTLPRTTRSLSDGMMGLDIFLVARIEVLIWRSRGLVHPGESQWTFGQTLALFLVIIPLVYLGKDLRQTLSRGARPTSPTPTED